MRKEILLVEDDCSLNRAVSLKLEREGYQVYAAENAEEAYAFYREHNVTLIICDIDLPDGSGLDFCMEVRRNERTEAGGTVFLFLTAMDNESDMINGYEAGCDDYITKPFSLAVLISKVNAIMSRYGGSCSVTGSSIHSGNIELDTERGVVKKDGEYLNLTLNEHKLLRFFMENPGRILSKNQLLESIWDIDGSFIDDNTVAVNIRRLREKIEDDPSDPAVIKNVRGLGYIWERECERR